MAEEWKWMDTPPLFSVQKRRLRNLVRVPYGVTLAPVGVGYVWSVVAFALSIGVALAAAAFTFERTVLLEDARGWWGLAVTVPALIVVLFTGADVYIEGTARIMKTAPLTLILLGGTFGGGAVGFGLAAVNQTSLVPWSNGGYIYDAPQLMLPMVITAVISLVLVILAIPAARQARSEVARVLRLRESGQRQQGVILRRPDPETWNDGGDVPIRYGEGSEERMLVVRLNTGAHRIPVRGSRVIVFTDLDGSLLVEIDPEHPLEFIANSSPYEADTSGGGS